MKLLDTTELCKLVQENIVLEVIDEEIADNTLDGSEPEKIVSPFEIVFGEVPDVTPNVIEFPNSNTTEPV